MKTKREFDINNVLTCVTVDKAKESYWNSDANGGLSSEKNYILGFIAGVKENEQEKCELLGIIQQKDELIKKMKCCENCKDSYHDRHRTLQCIRNCINFDNWELAE